MSAEAIARALNLRRSGHDFVGKCPSCGYRSGFSVTEEDGKLLAYCAAGGCDHTAVWSALVKLGLVPEREPLRRTRRPARIILPQPTPPKTDADIAASKEWQSAARIWQSAAPTAGSPADDYLLFRGITRRPIPDVLRFSLNLWHRETGERGPGMVAIVEHVVFGHVGIHRTWLRPDGGGKADLDPDKMSLGPIDGGAIRLGPIGPNGELAVAEGIEDALSFTQLTGQPCWSALTAGGIERIVLPPEVRFVAIAADNDKRGREAAQVAARRWLSEGRRVWFARPPIGKDWNDTLRARARGVAA
jgi:hypothetical protein